MNDLLLIIKRYNIEKDVLKWAGAFRYLQSMYPEGFSLENWIKLNIPMDIDLARTIIRILINEDLIMINENNQLKISDDIKLQRTLELVNTLVNFNFSNLQQNNSDLLWTISRKQFNTIPMSIAEHFRYLYTWIQEIILTSTNRVIFVAPYFSEPGMRQLLTSLNAINNNKQDITIDFLVNDIDESNNFSAFNYLKENLTLLNNNKIRIFEPVEKTNNKLWFHAKLLLVDNKKGYLGSANYSERGMSSQFEIGVPLEEEQTQNLTKLIDYWLANCYFKMYLEIN